jgi:hypothetical protein
LLEQIVLVTIRTIKKLAVTVSHSQSEGSWNPVKNEPISKKNNCGVNDAGRQVVGAFGVGIGVI